MRIISGKFKGKKIKLPLDKNTRPLKDLTKESIFNLITHSKKLNFNFDQSNILDMFAGSGSFGLECLSRNAKHVTFIENYKPAYNILRKNLISFDLHNNYEILDKNIFFNKIYKHLQRKYDLIFLDPPYKEKNIKKIFSIIFENKILKRKGLLIMHRNKKSCDFIGDEFKEIEKRTYGISKIIFFTLR